MKNILLTLMVFGIVGCSQQEATKTKQLICIFTDSFQLSSERILLGKETFQQPRTYRVKIDLVNNNVHLFDDGSANIKYETLAVTDESYFGELSSELLNQNGYNKATILINRYTLDVMQKSFFDSGSVQTEKGTCSVAEKQI